MNSIVLVFTFFDYIDHRKKSNRGNRSSLLKKIRMAKKEKEYENGDQVYL